MLRRLALLSGWLAATVAVVGLGWAAVGTVAGAVTEPPPLVRAPAQPGAPTTAAGPTPVEGRPGPAGPSDPAGEGAAAASEPAGPPAQQAEVGTRAFDMAGGTVGVRIGADAVGLAFATPRPGFSVEVRARGPARVDVRFSSDDHESRFRYELDGGERLEERPG